MAMARTRRKIIGVLLSPPGGHTTEYLSIAGGALSEPLAVPEDQIDAYARAQDQVGELLDLLGWNVDPDSPGPAAWRRRR